MAGAYGKLNPEITQAICDALATGVPAKHAAAIGGIAEGTFYQWLVDSNEFQEAVKKAKALGVQARLKRIESAGKNGTWQADAWWLERVEPNHFAKRLNVDSTVTHRASPPDGWANMPIEEQRTIMQQIQKYQQKVIDAPEWHRHVDNEESHTDDPEDGSSGL